MGWKKKEYIKNNCSPSFFSVQTPSLLPFFLSPLFLQSKSTSLWVCFFSLTSFPSFLLSSYGFVVFVSLSLNLFSIFKIFYQWGTFLLHHKQDSTQITNFHLPSFSLTLSHLSFFPFIPPFIFSLSSSLLFSPSSFLPSFSQRSNPFRLSFLFVLSSPSFRFLLSPPIHDNHPLTVRLPSCVLQYISFPGNHALWCEPSYQIAGNS